MTAVDTNQDLIAQGEQLRHIKADRQESQDVLYWRGRAYQSEACAAWVHYVQGLIDGGETITEHMVKSLGGSTAIEPGGADGLRADNRRIWELCEAGDIEGAQEALVAMGKRMARASRVLREGMDVARRMVCVRTDDKHVRWVDENLSNGQLLGMERLDRPRSR